MKYKFKIKDKVKLVKKEYWMQIARKGQVGGILKCGISLSEPHYWVSFKGGEEWWSEKQIEIKKSYTNS